MNIRMGTVSPETILGYRKNGKPIFPIAGGAPDDDNFLPQTLDDIKGKTPEQLRSIVEILDAHLRDLHQNDIGELRDMSDDEQAAFTLGMELREWAVNKIEEHRKIADIFARRPKAVERVYNNIRHGLPDDDYADVRRLTNSEARERALRILDSKDKSQPLKSDQMDQVETYIRRDTDMARRVLVTENEDYREGWMKMVTQPDGSLYLTEKERAAMLAYNEYRAMSEGTSASGGYGIPVFIDPSIILTAQGSGNPFLTLCRQIPVNTNAWKGVSSAGVSWAFQAEATAVTDDSPTLAQPTVNVNMARGFLPFSIELDQDYPGFADEMATLLAAGYDELLVDKFTRGSGTNEPNGIVTALAADTTVQTNLATRGTLATGDVYGLWQALPQRFRRNASWLMSVNINNKIRQLGTANVFHAYTVNLPAEWADMLFGKQTFETPYMTDLTTSAGTNNVAVVGDFSNYVIARRGGMSVELVPLLVDVTNNRPTGQRGWFAYARIGGGPSNNKGFQLLNQT